MSKHTPGPWIFSPEVPTIRSQKESEFVACILGSGTAEDDANGRLIAAAPEMLEALKAIVKSYEAHEDGYARSVLRAHFQAASTLIAKAEGRDA